MRMLLTTATKQCTLSSAADCSLKAFTAAKVLGSSSSATGNNDESGRARLYEVKEPALILLSTCNVETMARALGVNAVSSAAAAASFLVNVRLPASASPALQIDVSSVDAAGKAESKKEKRKAC